MRIDRVKLVLAAMEQDIKLKDLAEKAGISYVTMVAVKGGKSCSNETAQKIADALEMPLDDLLEKK